MERASARALVFLHQLPAWVLPVVLVVLLITGLAVRGPGGGLALLGLAAVLSWLAYISWPGLNLRGRALRALAIAVVVGIAALQAVR